MTETSYQKADTATQRRPAEDMTVRWAGIHFINKIKTLNGFNLDGNFSD